MSSSASRRPQGFARLRQRLGNLLGRGSGFRRALPGQGLFLLLLLTLLVGPNGALTSLSELGAFGHLTPPAAKPLTPMTQDQALANQANAWGHASGTQPQTRLSQYVATPADDVIPRQVNSPQPGFTGSVALSATADTTLTTSDGRFSMTIPAGTLSSADLATVGGPVTLQVTQLAGPLGGGSSGHLSLGTYRIELIGPNGRLTGLSFRHAVTLALHYDAAEAGAFINYGVSVSMEADTPTRANPTAPTGTAPASLPPHEFVSLSPQAKSQTVSGQALMSALPLTGSMLATFNTNAPQAVWPTVQDFQTNLNSGSLNYSYPLDLPPAPGGFLPNVNLSYSSASVNEDHGLQTSAPWTGEGWSLDLGSISWSQIDENSGCQQGAAPPPYNPNCGTHNWQNTWNISAAGIGGPLIPQNINWATGPNAAGFTATSAPAEWYTAPESHAKIWMINCTTTDLQSNAWTHPCWRVWLPSGEMLEFGATNDSVEYYVDLLGNKYIYNWKVDAMVDTHGNQIHVGYNQYTATYPITAVPYVRDAELATVSYDSPTCQSTSAICPTTGSAPNLWQPMVRVVFDQATKPTRLTGAIDPTCQTWTGTSARCDTATDFSGGLVGPQVTSVAVLNALEIQVSPSGNGSWNLLKAYALSYEQTSQITGVNDSISGEQENVAGSLDLTKIQQFGNDWTGNTTNTGTSWPAMQYSYSGSGRSTLNCTASNFPCTDNSSLQERYTDPAYVSKQLTGGVNQCVGWVGSAIGCKTYASSETLSQRYLTEADNGMGWQETFTWQEGHMNVVGVPSGRAVTNPFACTTSDETTSPCWKADEQHWSRILLVSRDARTQRAISGSPTITVAHHFAYSYTMQTVQSGNAWCVSGVCPVIWDFGNVNDGDYLDYYNSEFRGFIQTHVIEQEVDTGGGSCTTACTIAVEDHYFITTQGWGVWNSTEVTTKQGCWNYEGGVYLCPTSPYWSSSNMPAGRETQIDQWASNGTTLLRRTLNTYTLNCGPTGDPTTPSPASFDSNWWTIAPPGNLHHLLVEELDQSNPIVVCDPQLTTQQTILVDGGSVSGAPSTTVTYSYDTSQSYSASHDYGNMTVTDTVASDGGSVGGSGNDIVQTADYTINDNITTTSTSATGTYIVDTPYQKATRSGSATGTIKALTQDYYDGNTSLTAAPTKGNVTRQDVAYSGTGPYSYLTTKEGYDSYGNLVGTLQPNGQTGCTVGGTSYSTCATYDTSSYTAHLTQVTNALGQHPTTFAYGSASSPGFGEWMQTNTDANSQTTTYQYDALGRLTSTTLPGEGTGLLTTQFIYSTSACPATGPSIPCSEMDTIQRYDTNPPVTTRTYYDGWGKVAETRVPADSTHDVIKYTTYDAREEAVFTSRAYYVATGTGYSAPDSTQLGSSSVYDSLGRLIQATDPAGATTTTSYAQMTGPDSATYEGTQVINANHNESKAFTDALGRQRYAETFTGTSTYILYSTISQVYDFQGNLTTITHPDGTHTTTATYDLAGRKTGGSDPDLGSFSVQLDADGNITQQTDARGQTVYLGYDALDRQLWRNTTNSPTGAYVTYTYDGTVPGGVTCTGITPGSNAVGHVTTEQFTSGPSNSLSGSYCYAYDARGEQTGEIVNIADGTAPYQLLQQYNDAGVVTQTTYPTGMVAQFLYSSQERLTEITHTVSGSTKYVVHDITYNGAAGAAGQPDSYVLGGSLNPCSSASPYACASLTYDNDLRLASETFTNPSPAVTYYAMSRTYDAVGNVTSVSSTLPAAGSQSGGQDNQQFCYDALNRLTWAGTSGTNPCTNLAVTGSTLTNASYMASYTYNVSNRITQSTLSGALASSPQGSYTYDSTHYHAVDAIGTNAYEAQYDASGNMTCRTPTGPKVCTSSTKTGASLTYDVEGRLIQWVSADGSTTVKYGYDGEGNRFEMTVTNGSTTTKTLYIAGAEDAVVNGTIDDYISYLGQRLIESNWTQSGGTNSIYDLLGDGLGSPTVRIGGAGVHAAQLYGPYGQLRWSGGTMVTTYGFTGQHSDVATGLDYYGARYYDPAAGIFISADTVLGKGAGLNRYGYVAGNPETATDPSGHYYVFHATGNGPCEYPDYSNCNVTDGKKLKIVDDPCAGVDPFICTTGGHKNAGHSFLRDNGISQTWGGDTDEITVIGITGLERLITDVLTALEKAMEADVEAGGSGGGAATLAGILVLAAAGLFTFSGSPGIVLLAFSVFAVGADLTAVGAALSSGHAAQFDSKGAVDDYFQNLISQVHQIEDKASLDPDQDFVANQEFIFREYDTYATKSTCAGGAGRSGGGCSTYIDYSQPAYAEFKIIEGPNLLGNPYNWTP